MRNVLINNYEYQFLTDISNITPIRQSFNELTEDVFEISFEDWYQRGYWKSQYKPYVLLDNDEVVANVSVNQMSFRKNQKIINGIQIGTVCTKENYRNKGLIRFLINQILEDYPEQCIYLFANDTVLDFYPKFGFKHQNEKQYYISNNHSADYQFKKINISEPNTMNQLERLYQIGNPYSQLEMINNLSLAMFYLQGPFREMIYYSEVLQTIVVYDEESQIIFDVYGMKSVSLEEIVGSLSNASKVILGFAPIDMTNISFLEGDFDDNALFVLNDYDDLFTEIQCLPYLSHA